MANVAEDSSGRMGEGMQDFARDSDDAALSADGVRDSAQDAAGMMAGLAGSADDADGALQNVAGSGDDAAAGVSNAAGAADNATGMFNDLTGAVDGVIGSLGDAGGDLEVVTGGATEVAGGIGELFTALQTGTAGAAGAAGTVGIAALGTFVALGSGAVGAYKELLSVQGVLDSSALEAEMWLNVMGNAGLSAGTLSKMAFKMGADIATAAEEIAAGGEVSASTAAIIDQLGVSIYDANGNMRSTSDIMSDVVGALGNMEDKTRRQDLATDIFGKRLAFGMLPLLNNYTDAVHDGMVQTDKFGGGMDDASEQSYEYNKQMQDLHLQIQELQLKVGPPFIAFLGAVVTGTSNVVDVTISVVDWIKRHKDEVILLGTVLVGLVSWPLALTMGGLALLKTHFEDAAGAAEALIGMLDRLRDAAAKVGDIGGGIVGKVVGGATDAAEWAGSKVPFMDEGGVVPGPRGAPRLIMAHGGETVLPTHKTGGGAPQITVTNHIYGVQNAEDLARETERSVSRALFRMGFA